MILAACVASHFRQCSTKTRRAWPTLAERVYDAPRLGCAARLGASKKAAAGSTLDCRAGARDLRPQASPKGSAFRVDRRVARSSGSVSSLRGVMSRARAPARRAPTAAPRPEDAKLRLRGRRSVLPKAWASPRGRVWGAAADETMVARAAVSGARERCCRSCSAPRWLPQSLRLARRRDSRAATRPNPNAKRACHCARCHCEDLHVDLDRFRTCARRRPRARSTERLARDRPSGLQRPERLIMPAFARITARKSQSVEVRTQAT